MRIHFKNKKVKPVMKLFQNELGEYLPDTAQFHSQRKEYLPHNSTRYINVSEEVREKKRLPHLYDRREECCGCTACYAVCPVSGSKFSVEKEINDLKYIQTGAITMIPDEKGFLYPVVDAKSCIRCYKCEEICSFTPIATY